MKVNKHNLDILNKIILKNKPYFFQHHCLTIKVYKKNDDFITVSISGPTFYKYELESPNYTDKNVLILNIKTIIKLFFEVFLKTV